MRSRSILHPQGVTHGYLYWWRDSSVGEWEKRTSRLSVSDAVGWFTVRIDRMVMQQQLQERRRALVQQRAQQQAQQQAQEQPQQWLSASVN